MSNIMITGANRGLGLGFAKKFAKNGWNVLAMCRSLDNIDELNELSKKFNVSINYLDVLDYSSIEESAKNLKDVPIDILLNNAGIQGAIPQNYYNIDYDEWVKVFSTNVMSTMKVSQSFINNIEASKKKLIVNVSSGTSSINQKKIITSKPSSDKGELYLYRTSKTALNMISRCMAWELMPRGVAVVLLGPGWVRTRLGGPKAKLSIDESINNCYPLINSWTIKNTGSFYLYDGSEIPW
ncbi:SDR family oxidoreductase [Alphaproteobacteria bacterium]|nr:SDR family oxidoreductase [Alphaproteobacteria bacterium]